MCVLILDVTQQLQESNMSDYEKQMMRHSIVIMYITVAALMAIVLIAVFQPSKHNDTHQSIRAVEDARASDHKAPRLKIAHATKQPEFVTRQTGQIRTQVILTDHQGREFLISAPP